VPIRGQRGKLVLRHWSDFVRIDGETKMKIVDPNPSKAVRNA